MVFLVWFLFGLLLLVGEGVDCLVVLECDVWCDCVVVLLLMLLCG